jgi:hypothetical protein
MKRIITAMLPATMLLLASCSWMYPAQKSELGMARQAADIAGADDVTGHADPIELVPAKTKPSAQSAAPATASKPVVILPAAAPVTIPANATTVSSQAAVPNAPVDAAVIKPAVMPEPQAPAGHAANAAEGAVMALAQPLAAGPVAAPAATSADVDNTPRVGNKVPANGTAIHLASYREIGSAKRGWQILSKSYKELIPLKPLYVAVDIPGKGHMLRLYGTGTDAASLKTICSEMQAEGAYCAANIAF